MRSLSYESDFDLHENETACRTHFHIKGFALRLVLKQRHKRTRKWPIREFGSSQSLRASAIILRKMSYLGVDQAAIKWFSSYLSGRTQRCSANGKLSTARTLTCGVPQGSILGPLQFLIYINDLLNSLRDAVPRRFANDTNLTAQTLTELKLALTHDLNNLSCWLKANRLSLNVAKTELMIIGSRHRLSVQCDDLEIKIDDQIIKRVDHTKSLGLTIDDHLS